MKISIYFLIGLITGASIAIWVQFTNSHITGNRSIINPGPVGSGYYSGPIPDFSYQPVSGNVYSYIDSSWVLHSLTDKKISFHEFEGKVLFLNLWATWCSPCIEEMPEINKLRQAIKSDDIVVLLISEEQEIIVQAFDNTHDLPLFVSRGGIPVIFKGKGLPSTFIIDKSGTIRYKHAGKARWSHPSVINFLQGLVVENGG